MHSGSNAWIAALAVSFSMAAPVGSAADRDLRLVAAVKNQDHSAIRTLLNQPGVDPDAAQGDGATALHWAAHWNDLEALDLLLRAGANVNASNDLGITPLWVACSNGYSAAAARLAGAGADPNRAAPSGVSPLMLAARTGSVLAVQALLEKGANVNAVESSNGQTALMWAVSRGHPEVVRVLLEHGADVDARTRVREHLVIREETAIRQSCPGATPATPCVNADMAETGGFTALLFAARQGDLDSARLLIAHGANANEAGPDGNSALVIAAHSGNGPVAMFLLDKDANPNAAGAGYTALHAAVLRGELPLVEALLSHGANPNASITRATPINRDGLDFVLPATLLGTTPFFLAAKFLDVAAMRVLLAHGANPLVSTKDGTTALMAAAGLGWVAGEDRRGSTLSIGIAVPRDEADALEAAKILIEQGEDVNAANRAGDTALHAAASKGYNSVVELLAAKGAKLDVKNRRGLTPLGLTADAGEGAVFGQLALRSTNDLLRKLGAK